MYADTCMHDTRAGSAILRLSTIMFIHGSGAADAAETHKHRLTTVL